MDPKSFSGAAAICAVFALACGSDPSSDDRSQGGTSSVGGASPTGGGSGSGGTGTGGGNGGNGNGGDGNGGGIESGGAAGSGNAGDGGTGGTVTPMSPHDWVGVIGMGQSLSVGWDAPAVDTNASFDNLMLRDNGADPKYPLEDSATAAWSAEPLANPIRVASAGTGPGYSDGQYPNNIWHSGDTYGETPHVAMANAISWTCQARGDECVTAHTVVGNGALDNHKKGTRQYQGAVNEAKVFKALADAAGKSYGVGAVVLTHGETDAFNPSYGTGVYELIQDLDTDLKAVTGQSQDVILIASQQSSTAAGWGTTSGSAVQIWKAAFDHPGEIVISGPKYQYGAYGLHMAAGGYERIGEKYGEVFDLIVNQKVDWRPVGPKSVSRTGAVITIEMDVPNPPLVWDENLSKPHQSAHSAWSEGRGFEVIDQAKNELEIASVAIDEDSIVLTLAEEPAPGTSLKVGYALTPDTDEAYQGGTALGPHGQLADSDTFQGNPETIEANVTSGSTAVTGLSFHRAPFDLVSGDELPQGTILLDRNWDSGTLSQAWAGATGKATLTFQHNHRNYCVHFAMDVP
jgi:hypothetical protein